MYLNRTFDFIYHYHVVRKAKAPSLPLFREQEYDRLPIPALRFPQSPS